MFARRKPDAEESPEPSRLTQIRDVVEIVAIVAAGVWAFYTFVYENQIKPALTKPEVQIETSMTRLGERKGLVAVRLSGTISNIGKTEVWLYTIAESVVGDTVAPRTGYRFAGPGPGASIARAEPGWTTGAPVGVYASAVLTDLANPSAHRSYNLAPGQSIPIDTVFYVLAGRYDRLRCSVDVRYAGSNAPVPLRLTAEGGILRSVPTTARTTFVIDEESSVLALW